MEGDDIGRQTLPFRRHSAALTEFFTRKTRAWIIPPLSPPPLLRVAWFCFWLCKITVVQVSRRRRHVDGLARKKTAKHLCSPQRSFLSYNRLSCPEWSFGFTARPSSGTQRTMEGAFQDDRLPLSKGSTRLADSSVSHEIATGTWTGQTGRKGGKRREETRQRAEA